MERCLVGGGFEKTVVKDGMSLDGQKICLDSKEWIVICQQKENVC